MTDTEPKLVDKFNHGLDQEVDALVHEYANLHEVGLDTNHRVNVLGQRDEETTSTRRSLEGILGTGTRDRHKAINLMEALITRAYELDKNQHEKSLQKDPFKKRKEITDYLTPTGVTYETLVKAIANLNGPVDLDKLPDDNPLKRVINYIVTKSHDGQARVQFLQQTLVDIGDAKAPAVAEAFNKYAPLNLDPRYAKPQDSFQAYGQYVQGQIAQYNATDPSKVHNKEVQKKAA